MFNKSVWLRGEALALEFLKKQKYEILKTNYKNKIGEIDIVAKEGNVFVFVEVKARQTRKFGLPCEAVGVLKQNKIRAVATEFLLKHSSLSVPARFDVVEIIGGKIAQHIKNAF